MDNKERFFGFDLGDAESAIALLEGADQKDAQILPINSERSFITAYARKEDGSLIIGESACYAPDVTVRRVRFKSRFLTDQQSAADIRSFAGGVISALRGQGQMAEKSEDSEDRLYVGCPAGWDKNAREEYRAIFEQIGAPPTKIVSESRAALVSACQSRHLQVGYDILSQSVLVVDIGSSTTDFAYITEGRETQLQTAGEVLLGGGIMDELLLSLSVEASPYKEEILEIFEKSPAWHDYCDFTARRVKETYYSDEEYWSEAGCRKTVVIRYDKPVRLSIIMDKTSASQLTQAPSPKLNGRSFRDVFMESLRDVRSHIEGDMPALLFLTGGVSRLPAIREWCREVFPESVVVTSNEPEFSVARGLAFCARVDSQVRAFKEDVARLIESPKVEKIVKERIPDLYRAAADTLIEPILENAVIPVFERWRAGSIRKLSDVDGALQKEISAWLHSGDARQLLHKPVAAWLKSAAGALEEYTIPICIRHHIPHSALNLTSYLSLGDMDIRVDAKEIFAVEEITWLIDTIITVLVTLLCGGSGIALIAGGLPGIVAGAVLSMLILFLGKGTMEKALLSADIPAPIRKLVPKNHFRTRIESLSSEIKTDMFANLEKQKQTETSERMAQEISSQIEECLVRMAEVVEIPLG